jgi:hypothetical protein
MDDKAKGTAELAKLRATLTAGRPARYVVPDGDPTDSAWWHGGERKRFEHALAERMQMEKETGDDRKSKSIAKIRRILKGTTWEVAR